MKLTTVDLLGEIMSGVCIRGKCEKNHFRFFRRRMLEACSESYNLFLISTGISFIGISTWECLRFRNSLPSHQKEDRGNLSNKRIRSHHIMIRDPKLRFLSRCPHGKVKSPSLNFIVNKVLNFYQGIDKDKLW